MGKTSNFTKIRKLSVAETFKTSNLTKLDFYNLYGISSIAEKLTLIPENNGVQHAYNFTTLGICTILLFIIILYLHLQWNEVLLKDLEENLCPKNQRPEEAPPEEN